MEQRSRTANRRKLLALLVGEILAAGSLAPAHAANMSVAAGAVASAPDGLCSLIEAIDNANADIQLHGDCPPGSGPDTIHLATASIYTLNAIHNLTNGNNGLPSVNSSIVVEGNSSTVERNAASATGFRMFHVAAGGDLTLRALTMRNGEVRGTTTGGALYNASGGQLTLTDSVVSSNLSQDRAGAITNHGSLRLTGSTVSNNHSSGSGGGIDNSGTLILTNSSVADNTISGSFGSRGGGIYNSGALELIGSTVSGNSARVGGILNAGTAQLTDSAVAENTSGYGAGGLENTASGMMTITASTVSGNTNSGDVMPGGIFNAGEMHLSNTTVSGNRGFGIFAASSPAGGIINWGMLTAINSTIANNRGSGYSAIGVGGLENDRGGTVTLLNNVIADNLSYGSLGTAFPSDCRGAASPSNRNNLIESGNCDPTWSTDPLLGPLADNGGPTLTHALLSGSPAIDVGDPPTCDALFNDQRGFPRSVDGDNNGSAICDLGAYEFASLSMNVAAGSVEVANDGFCSLIEAIDNANADAQVHADCAAGSGADIITLADGSTYTLQAVHNNTNGGNGLPSITSPMTLRGSNATIARSAAAGTPEFRLLQVASAGDLTIDHLRLENGSAVGINQFGGAVRNLGAVALRSTRVSGNSALYGGAIFNDSGALLTLERSTLEANHATVYGGGLQNLGNAVISDSTLSGNRADAGGAGLWNLGSAEIYRSTVSGNSGSSRSAADPGIGGAANLGTLTLSNSTISDNTGVKAGGLFNSDLGTLTLLNTTVAENRSDSQQGVSGGLYNAGGTLHLTNALLAGNTGDCDSDPLLIATNRNTLIADGSCSPAISGDPLLGPLADNGGPTLTHALLEGSPALDAGDQTTCGTMTTDQRGEPRSLDADGEGVTICDIGAYELASSWISVPGGAVQTLPDGLCSLTEAIDNANADAQVHADCPAGAGPDTIILAASATYTLNAVNNNIDGANGLPSITSPITLRGNDATIERSPAAGTPDFRLFHIDLSGDLLLYRVTLQNGAAEHGGALLNHGAGILNNTTVSNNSAAFGGALSNEAGGMLMLNTSVLAGNSSDYNGGGVFNLGSLLMSSSTVAGNSSDTPQPGHVSTGGVYNAGLLTVEASTVSGNSGVRVGGLQNNFEGDAHISNSTVSGNRTSVLLSGDSGGILNAGALTLSHSTVADNLGNDSGGLQNLAGSGPIAILNTLIANNTPVDCSGALIATNLNNFIADGTCNAPLFGTPFLGPLADHGGPTLTHALLTGSPAIDQADPTACGSQSTDQRGLPRPLDGDDDGQAVCDIGSYEAAEANTASTITVTPPEGLVTTEQGAGASLTVVLDTTPTAEVTIALSSTDPSEGVVSPRSLLFDLGNWDLPQGVTLSGVRDLIPDGDTAYFVQIGPAASLDPLYDGATGLYVSATNIDDTSNALPSACNGGSDALLQNLLFPLGQTTCTASGSIVAGPHVFVLPGADVLFQAPVIVLENGFQVDAEGQFTAGSP